MAGVSGAVTLRKALEGLGRSKVRKEAPSPCLARPGPCCDISEVEGGYPWV